MTMSVQEKINLGDAVFKWVQHTPVGHLKDLSDDDLEMIRQQLIKEVREVGSLDFHDVAVWSLKEALQEAYEAGKRGEKQSLQI